MTTYLSIVTIFILCALITNSTKNLHIVSTKTELTEIQPKPHIIDKFITLHDIQGQWTNSNNNNIRVKDTKVFFNGNRKVNKIKESDDRFILNGWILKKISKTFTWKKESTIEYPWYRLQTKYKSRFKGLHLHVPKTIYWVAQVYVDKTTMLHLGYFKNEENAVRAANKKRMELGMQLLTESSTNDDLNFKNNLERENVTNMKTNKILDTKSMSAEICLDNIDSTKSTNFENGYDIQSNIESPERNQNILFDDRDNPYHSTNEESSFEDDEYLSHNDDILQAQIWRQKWEMIRTGLQE